MASVESRPPQPLTPDNLMIGVPFVAFGKQTAPNVYESYRDLGIINEAAIAKELEILTLRSAHSGIDSIIREIVRRAEYRLNIQSFQFDADNLQLIMGSATKTAQTGGDVAVANDQVYLPAFPDWGELTNSIKDKDPANWTDLDASAITGEVLGTATGSPFGETTGDFQFDFKIASGDVAASCVIYHDGVDVTTLGFSLVAGTSPLTTEIAIEEGNSGATGARLTYFTGEGPANGVVVTADYTPTPTLTENTDFIVDYQYARVRAIGDGGASEWLMENQPIDCDYITTLFAGDLLRPFTQPTVDGRARIQLLTDVGINLIWPIPAVSLRINDDDFSFSREEFATGSLTLTLTDDGSSDPYGVAQVYDENAA
jgi:hypothetical protein